MMMKEKKKRQIGEETYHAPWEDAEALDLINLTIDIEINGRITQRPIGGYILRVGPCALLL
jgi:hypothetical protein